MDSINLKSSHPKLSIVLPVRNEGLNIILMVKILHAVISIPHEIIIIYDNPKDSSIPAIKKMKVDYPNIYSVLNIYGKGVINAIKSGVENANGAYVLLLAIDDVGPTLAVSDMITLMDQGCDFISCTRYKYGGRRLGGSLIEGALSRLGNSLFSFLSGSALSDATTGFKMFRKDVFAKLNLESKPVGWAVAFEMAVKAQAAGLRLGEIPITSIDRLYGGKSSFKVSPWLKEYGRWFIYGLKERTSLSANKHVVVRIPESTIS